MQLIFQELLLSKQINPDFEPGCNNLSVYLSISSTRAVCRLQQNYPGLELF
jgi:hypothetical protein